jgi:putative transposase
MWCTPSLTVPRRPARRSSNDAYKRLDRLLAQNGLQPRRYTGKPPCRAHDGQSVNLRTNLRRTSDGFEIACRNREVVHVTIALDTCDREAMAWYTDAGGISGEMIPDLTLEATEQ